MISPSLRRLTGALLILVPLAFTAGFTLLQVQFGYPDILRAPTEVVLNRFQAGGSGLVAAWYLLALTAVLFIPIAVLLDQVLVGQGAPAVRRTALAFGLLAGLAQTLGFLRWPFLVPHLAAAYLEPGASEAQRAAAVAVFEAFHRYAGMAVGEHLGYLSTSVWTFLVALLLGRALPLGRWLGPAGMALALGIAAGLLEPAGWALAGPINAISYLAWAGWLVAVGVALLRGQAAPAGTLGAARAYIRKN